MLDISSFSKSAKCLFLARLAHELTICARSTYEPGTHEVRQPALLRAYNELQHRVVGSLRDHLLGEEGFPLGVILEMVQAFGDEHARKEEVQCALKRAYQQMSARQPKVNGADLA
jgi:hypothetical protein